MSVTMNVYRKTIIFKHRTRWIINLPNGEKGYFKTLKAAKAYVDRERAANGEEERPF